MRQMTFRNWSLSVTALAVGLALGGQPVEGQRPISRGTDPAPTLDHTQFGFGVVGNVPETLVGLQGYVILPHMGGIGLYLDAKFDYENASGERAFEGALTAEWIENNVEGNKFVQGETSWRSFNAALVRPLTPYLIVYAGGGIAQGSEFGLYEDPSRNLGITGLLWVEDPRLDQTKVNFIAGTFLRLSPRVSTQFGFETQPKGFSVGVSLRLPRW